MASCGADIRQSVSTCCPIFLPDGTIIFENAAGERLEWNPTGDVYVNTSPAIAVFPAYNPNDPAKTFLVQAQLDPATGQVVYKNSAGSVLTEGIQFVAGEPCCSSFLGQDPCTGEAVAVQSICNPCGICVYADQQGNPLTLGTDFVFASPRAAKGNQQVPFNNISVQSLQRPEGANHAIVHVWGTDVVVTTNGTIPDPANCIGSAVSCGQTIELESANDIQSFLARALEPGKSGKLWIEYYCVPPTPLANSN